MGFRSKRRLGAHEKQQQPQQSGVNGDSADNNKRTMALPGLGAIRRARAFVTRRAAKLQFEKERAEILAEREKAKMSNPEAVDGIRKDASYHEESDAIMAELMRSSASNKHSHSHRLAEQMRRMGLPLPLPLPPGL